MTATTTQRRVIRRLDSRHTHVADIPDSHVTQITVAAKAACGVMLPQVTHCGAILRGEMAIAMIPGASVLCRSCGNATGITRAPADNNTVPPTASWTVTLKDSMGVPR